MDTSNVTRFEIIDHLPCDNCEGMGVTTDQKPCEICHNTGVRGREVVFRNKHTQLDVELQDDGRTLKVFLHQRYDEITGELSHV